MSTVNRNQYESQWWFWRSEHIDCAWLVDVWVWLQMPAKRYFVEYHRAIQVYYVLQSNWHDDHQQYEMCKRKLVRWKMKRNNRWHIRGMMIIYIYILGCLGPLCIIMMISSGINVCPSGESDQIRSPTCKFSMKRWPPSTRLTMSWP